MLSTLFLTGLAQSGLTDQTVGLPEDRLLRHGLPSVEEDVQRRVDGNFYSAKGVEPQDGLVVYIKGQHIDLENERLSTIYTVLHSNGKTRGCKMKPEDANANDVSEQLWMLEYTGEDIGPYPAYFLKNVAHPEYRMEFVWDNVDSKNPFLSLTCGKNRAPRYHWIFYDVSNEEDTLADDKTYQIINREEGVRPECRLTSMNYEDIGFMNTVYWYPNEEYYCSTGKDSMNGYAINSRLDNLNEFHMNYYPNPEEIDFVSAWLGSYEDTAPIVGNFRDFKLINPFSTIALWERVAGGHIDVAEGVEQTFTYTTGVSKSITETHASDTHYDVSVKASVGASAFGLDVSTEIGTSFGQSFSSSMTSGTYLDASTSVSITYTIPANTCVELLQMKSDTTDIISGINFEFKSNMVKLACCIGEEWRNPEYCEGENNADLDAQPGPMSKSADSADA